MQEYMKVKSIKVVDADVLPPPLELPERQTDESYIRPPITEQTFVPEVY